jgi:hypothetical protein
VWVRRILVLLIVTGVLIGAPLVWLYRGWKGEQGAIAQLQASHLAMNVKVSVRPLGGARLQTMLPWRMRPWLDRAESVEFAPDGPVFQTPSLDQADIAAIATLSRLREVDISGMLIYGRDLTPLSKLRNLETLRLGDASITDGNVAELGDMQGLRELWLDCSPNLTDQSLVSLRKARHLRVLSFGRSRLTDAGLANLKDMTELEELYLLESEVGDEGLRIVAGMTNLRTLDLQGCKRVTDKGLAYIDGLSELRGLDLGETSVTDAGLANLHGLRNLESLCIDNTDITDGGLAHVAGMASLTNLVLVGNRITDRGLAQLMGLTNLKRLTIIVPGVSEEGLLQLACLKNLAEINVDKKKIGPDGIARLKAAMPTVNVVGW